MDERYNVKRDHEADLQIVRDLLSRSSTAPDGLLPLLLEVQRRLGYIPKPAMRLVAQALNVSRAEVQGMVSFYHDLYEEPTAEHVVALCMAEACQAVGCRALAAHAQQLLGVGFGESTTDGRVQLESAYCFGNCAAGPTMRVGDRVYGRVTTAGFDALVAPWLEEDGSS